MAAVESENKVTVDWSDLHPDILHLISRKLHDILDFIRFRVVCRSWRLSSLISDPPPVLPWLLIFPPPCTQRKESHHQLFYSLSSKKFFTIPSAPSNIHRSTSRRYLVFWHNKYRDLHALFNPVTGNEVRLPPTHLSWDDDVHVNGDSVMIYRHCLNEIYIWQPEDVKWISRRVDAPGFRSMLVYCNGFYMELDGPNPITVVVDPKDTSNILKILPPVRDNNFKVNGFNYLIESFGELLAVCRLASPWVKESRFVVYRLHRGNGDLRWLKTNNIGDCILLLDRPGGTGLSILVSGKHCELKGNCIYFYVFQHANDRQFIILCRYDLEDNIVEELASLDKHEGCSFCWFVPSLQ